MINVGGLRGFLCFCYLRTFSPDMSLMNRQLYNLCQMFPEAASSAMKFVLRDAMHDMEGMVETTSRAAFPGLDVVSQGRVSSGC